jgi:hypothetical protein
MKKKLGNIIKSKSNIHRPDGSPSVFLFSMPRSGSTWLMELIWTQPGFKSCDEPLNLRSSLVRKNLGISEWKDLYDQDATLAMESYFRAFCDGRLGFMNPSPLRRHYRPLTQRIVFKVIHGGEDRINWFRDAFNSRIVLLLRHPIAVSLSREVYPRLHAFLNSDYRRHLTKDQLDYANRIFDGGTGLERGVLSWCLQNMVPLREACDDWAIVSYEQLVLEPRPVVMHLAHKLNLPEPERMLNHLATPSGVKAKSDAATQEVLGNTANRRSWLVEKWRERVGSSEERRVMEILERFELDAYRWGNLRPAERLWIGPSDVPDQPPARESELGMCLEAHEKGQPGFELPRGKADSDALRSDRG